MHLRNFTKCLSNASVIRSKVCRFYCANVLEAVSYSVSFNKFGKAEEVLFASKEDIGFLGAQEVCVRMIAAPINPADINFIEGSHGGHLPQLPAIAGYEGVGRVDSVGTNVTGLKPGDLVVCEVEAGHWWGTWRTIGLGKASNFRKIPSNIDFQAAATLSVNLCTAYRLLTDFAAMQPGDVMLQNGANSSVGRLLIQLAAQRGLVTVNVVRNQADFDVVEKNLKSLGATVVMTDLDFLSEKGVKVMRNLKKSKLALNSVGGKSAASLVKYLDFRGKMVTYGGMSKQPSMVPTGPMIFQDVSIHGFSIANWNRVNKGSVAQTEMWTELCSMLQHKKLALPELEQFKLSDFLLGLKYHQQPISKKKVLLVMSHD